MSQTPSSPKTAAARPAAGGRRDWIILGLILLVAALLRVSYLVELVRQPDFASPTADAGFHDYWARGLAQHDWKLPPGTPEPRINEVPYTRPPGYPYFLALVYLVTGGSYVGARVVQMLLGLVNIYLLFALARSIFGRLTGFAAAALAALYWAFIFYEGELQAPVLVITLVLAMFLFLRRWAATQEPRDALLAGLFLGLSALERPNTLVFAPVLAWWMYRVLAAAAGRTAAKGKAAPAGAGGWKAAIRPVALVAIASLVAIAPATIRNLAVAHDAVFISTNGPINLYIGNNDLADGSSLKIPNLLELSGMPSWSMFSVDAIAQGVSRKEGRAMKHSEVASWFQKQAGDWIKGHPGKFIQLTARRAALFWGPNEVSNNKAGQFEKAASPTLRFLPSFPWVFSLALLGAALVILERKKRPLAALAGTGHAEPALDEPGALATFELVGWFVLLYFLSFLPFIVADRFRVPIVPFLILPAAWAIVRTAALFRGQRASTGAVVIGCWAALAGLAHVSLASYKPEKAWWYTDRGLAYQRQGKMREAIAEFTSAVRANPGYVDSRLALGEALIQAGRATEAVPHFQDVARNRSNRTDVRLRLCELLLSQNRNAEALTELQSLTRDYPEEPDAWRMLGQSLATAGQADGALVACRKALALRQGNPDAWLALGNSFIELKQPKEGEECYQQALQANPRHVESMINIGNLRSREGKIDEALRWYRQAVDLAPRNPVARINLGGAYYRKGDFVSARREVEEVLRIDPANVPAQKLRDLVRGAPPGGPKP